MVNKPELKVQSFSDLPKDLLEALGRVTAHSGHIEHLLALTLKRSTDKSWEDAHWHVRDLRERSKIQKEVRGCFDEWADQEKGGETAQAAKREFAKIIDLADSLATTRNSVVHCAWSTDGQKLNATRDGLPLLDQHGNKFGVSHVTKLADDLHTLACRLNAATRPDLVSSIQLTTDKQARIDVFWSMIYKLGTWLVKIYETRQAYKRRT